MQAVLSSLLFLKSETLEDAPAKKRAQRETELQAIHAALKSKASLPEALNQLASFFVEENPNPVTKKTKKTKAKKNSEVSGVCVCMCVYVYVCVHVCMYVFMYVCMYVCVYSRHVYVALLFQR